MKQPPPRSRRSAIFVAATFGIAAVAANLFLSSCSEAEAETSTEKTKIVVIAGKPSHASGEHEFFAGSTILANALNHQSELPLDVHVVRHGWPEDEAIFDGAAAIVIYSDGNAKHPVNGHEAKMDEMVKSGIGLMHMHYGVEVPAGEQGEYFKRWIGGHYESGFSTNPHWTADVELNADHPISNGVPGFSANDEWYYNIRFADPKTAESILTGVPSKERINRYVHWTPKGKAGLGKKQTMMWAVDRPDGGRGIGFTGGHWHRNWAVDDFRKVVLNAIVWTAKLDVPAAGVKSESVTKEQLNENLDEKDPMKVVELPSEADLTMPAADEPDFKWPGMEKKKK